MSLERVPGEFVDGQVDFGDWPERLKKLLELILGHSVRQVPRNGQDNKTTAITTKEQK